MSTNLTTSVQSKLNADEAAIRAKVLELKEAETRAKYPHIDIVPGSIVQDDNHPKFKNKIRVTLRCACGELVERATSDLFTFIGCQGCKKAVKKLTNARVRAILKAEQLKAKEDEAGIDETTQVDMGVDMGVETPEGAQS